MPGLECQNGQKDFYAVERDLDTMDKMETSPKTPVRPKDRLLMAKKYFVFSQNQEPTVLEADPGRSDIQDFW